MPQAFVAAVAAVLLVLPALTHGPAEWIQLPALETPTTTCSPPSP